MSRYTRAVARMNAFLQGRRAFPPMLASTGALPIGRITSLGRSTPLAVTRFGDEPVFPPAVVETVIHPQARCMTGCVLRKEPNAVLLRGSGVHVPAGGVVEILREHKGLPNAPGWLQVRWGENYGWVRSDHVTRLDPIYGLGAPPPVLFRAVVQNQEPRPAGLPPGPPGPPELPGGLETHTIPGEDVSSCDPIVSHKPLPAGTVVDVLVTGVPESPSRFPGLQRVSLMGTILPRLLPAREWWFVINPRDPRVRGWVRAVGVNGEQNLVAAGGAGGVQPGL